MTWKWLLAAPFGLLLYSGGITRVAVDPRQQFQAIEGFGVNFTGPYFRDDQKEMFSLLIDDLGATIFRVVPYFVYSDWETVNDNDDPNVMNWEYYNNRYSSPVFEASWTALRYLNSRGVRPVIALMGPAPAWMLDDKASRPRHAVCGNPDQYNGTLTHLNPAMYEEFAEEVVSMAVYARAKAHVEFRDFSPFNETDCYPTEGPRVDPGEASRLLEVIARRMRKEGLGDVRLTVADQAVISNNYIGPILKSAELMKQVGAFTFHTYGESSVGPQVERVKRSAYPETPIWLTEYGDLGDRDRSSGAEWKRFSLAANRRALIALNQGANAVLYFNAFDDYEECSRRLTYHGLFTSADHVYSRRKRYYATKQLYHFVPSGSRRIGAVASTPSLVISAFRAPDGSLIVVGVKEGGANRIDVTLPLSESIPPVWDLYQTTRELSCVKTGTLKVKGGHAEFDLPDEAVFTLVGPVK